jgi:6-phosphogluconolactonase
MTRYLYVGSATQQDGMERAEGIFVFRVGASGAVEQAQAVVSGANPSFLAFHPSKKYLFSVNETSDGGASAFTVDPESGNLRLINRVKVSGDDPCYASVSPDGCTLLIANYSSGSLTVVPVGEDGRLGERIQLVQHKGFAADPRRKLESYDESMPQRELIYRKQFAVSGEGIPAGALPERQEKAHAHCIVFDPTARYALAADLGQDRVWVYRFQDGRLAANREETTGKAPGGSRSGGEKERMEYGWMDLDPHSGGVPVSMVETRLRMDGHNLKPGSGPRHIAFHPNGRFFYVSNEMGSTVTVFAWDGELGFLKPLQSLSTLPESFTGQNDVAHGALTPNGEFLYVSNRGHNSLAAFSVDSQTGLLAPAGHTPTQGDWPRNFCIDSDGERLYAANQHSGSIAVFSIDPSSGALEPTREMIHVPAPFFVTVVDL